MDNSLYRTMIIAHGLEGFYNSEKSLIRYYRSYAEEETVDFFF